MSLEDGVFGVFFRSQLVKLNCFPDVLDYIVEHFE